MNKLINLFLALLFIIPVVGQAQITTDRQDGRFQSTRGTVQYMLKQMKPAYAFDPSFTPAEFKEWQSGLRTAMKELMHFPEIADLPAPVCIKTGILSVAGQCCSLFGVNSGWRRSRP